MNSKKLLLYASLRSAWRLEIYRNLCKSVQKTQALSQNDSLVEYKYRCDRRGTYGRKF